MSCCANEISLCSKGDTWLMNVKLKNAEIQEYVNARTPKPVSYQSMANLAESINVTVIYYEKGKDGITFEIP